MHALAIAVPPNSYEEILAMPVFGSPHVLERGRQLWLDMDWAAWPEAGVSTVGDLWEERGGEWRTAYGVWARSGRGAYGCVTDAGLRRLRSCVPADWVTVLRQGRAPPDIGTWVVLRSSSAPHQGGLLLPDTRLGLVLGFDPDRDDGRQGLACVELSQWDEFSRRFEPVVGSDTEQMMWCDADWSIVRAEFDPDGNKGRGVYYGATHDVYSWVPKRVEWRHPRTHGLVGTLAAYSVQLGRKLLMPEQNTMARRAIKVWRLMRDRYSPTLPQALDHVWRHNTWSPRTREYTWRVLSGLQYTSAMQWVGAVEAWQVACPVCLSNGVPADECADTIAHRYGQCSLAAMAWAWTKRVLRVVGLDYFGTMSGFWLYGGSRELMKNRVVSVIRGAFFEAQQAVRWRMRQDCLRTSDDMAVALLTRQHVIWEMERDVFFLSPDFAVGYDFRGARSGRPNSEVELYGVWGRLLVPSGVDETRFVAALPLLVESLDDESVDTVCAVCGRSPRAAPANEDGPTDDGPNDAAGNYAGTQVSPACMLCAECEVYYSDMYAKPVTVSETTCSTCGSSCEKCDTECENSNCEICNANCKRCDANCANQKTAAKSVK